MSQMEETEEVDEFGRVVPRETPREPTSDNEYEESDSRRRRRQSFSPEQSRRRSRSPVNQSTNQQRRSRSRSRERGRPFSEDRNGRSSTGSMNNRHRSNNHYRSDNQSYDRRHSDFVPRMVGPPVPVSQPPIQVLKRTFFDAHKTDDWFIDQYGYKDDQTVDSTISPPCKPDEARKLRKTHFDSDMIDGCTAHYHLDDDVEQVIKPSSETSTTPTESSDQSNNQSIKQSNKQSDKQSNKQTSKYIDNTIVIPRLLLKHTRQQIGGLFEQLPGYRCITLSPVTQQTGPHRVGFVLFRSDADCIPAYEKVNLHTIDGFELRLRPNGRIISKREAPYTTKQPERVLIDLEKVVRVVKHLDEARSITDNVLFSNSSINQSIQSKSPIAQLNYYLAYLRYVHCYCYYCAEQFTNLEQLFHRCGQTHLRSSQPNELDGEAMKRIDQAIDQFLSNQSNNQSNNQSIISTIHTQLIDAVYKVYVDKRSEGKYACKHCVNKNFKSEEFAQKHVVNKHPEALAEATKKANEEYMLEQYMQDSHALFDEKRAEERRQSGNHQQIHSSNLQHMNMNPMHFSPVHSFPPMAMMPSFAMPQHDIRGLRSYADLDKPDTAPVMPEMLLLTTPQEAKKHYADVGTKWQPKAKKTKVDATQTAGQP